MAKRGGRSGRKYVRDNRGRFATTGATARGGRLKTAGGKKRATQTVKAKAGGKPAGALKAKPRPEGQKYAGRIKAGKDLKRSQSVASQKKFLAKTQKRLDAAPLAQKGVTANSARATGKLTRPVAKGNIRRTGGRLGPKNTIKPGPKSPRTKMNRAIDNVIKKGKALKGSAEKLRGVKKQADALRGRMLKEDKGRLSKALSKPSVTDKRSRDYGGKLTKGARGQDPATGGKKSSGRPTSARDAATARLKIKTATRRKLKADRSSVIPANPKARRVQGARIGSTVAKKARAKGNAPATIANRVRRKAAVNKANLKENTRYGNATDGKRYVRQVKTSMTLDRAQSFLKTGKLPGKDNSIKAQRSFKAANARINANRAARRADRAEANIPMKGRRAKQLDASISKAAKQVKAAETARLMKPKAQRKSERAAKAEAKRQTAAAKPKRVRSAESLRVSRAKRITKERSISLNPAGNTQKGAGRMAANAKRTQDRALAFYKGKTKPAAAKPARRRGAVGKISEAKAGRIVARMDAQRGRKALPGRRNANFVRTYERSRQFILKPSTAALKKGKSISVNESVQKAVANAAKRRKPKRRRS